MNTDAVYNAIIGILCCAMAIIMFPTWLACMQVTYLIIMIDPALFIPAIILGAGAGVAIYYYFHEYLPAQEAMKKELMRE